MAFGGVLIGNSMATEVESATPTRRAFTPPIGKSMSPIPTPTALRIGTRRLAAAEWEMKLDIAYPRRPERRRIMSGLNDANGIACTRFSARPVLFNAIPRAKPPATIQRTLHSTFLRSSLVMTPVAQNTPTGIIATTLALTPVYLSKTHMRIVTANVTHTIYVLVSGFLVFSILSSILSDVNGKSLRRRNHANRSITIT